MKPGSFRKGVFSAVSPSGGNLKKFKKVLQLPYLLYYNIKVKFKKPNHKKYEGDEFGKSEQES